MLRFAASGYGVYIRNCSPFPKSGLAGNRFCITALKALQGRNNKD